MGEATTPIQKIVLNLHPQIILTLQNPQQKKKDQSKSQNPQKEKPRRSAPDESQKEARNKKPTRKAGKQPGAQGFWRKQPLKAEIIVPHYPEQCAACNYSLTESDCQLYMGHYVLELSQKESGFRLVCQLHHYYQATCSCGHCTHAKPGTGYVSVVEGRSRDLKLTEYVLVGPVLATFIASLGVRYRMSRANSRVPLLRKPQRGRSPKSWSFSMIGYKLN